MNNLLLLAFLGISLFVCPEAWALKVGVTAGPHSDIVKKISEIAEKQNLKIEIIEFNDFILPNTALDNGDIDINSYQHAPFLEEQIKDRGYNLKAVAKTVLMPIGIYSKKIKSLDDLPQGASMSLPNDPTNEGRALKLLAKLGMITVKNLKNPCLLDIISNPNNIRFVAIEAPLLPASIQDVDASIINTDWVFQGGLDPKSAIAKEDTTSPYINVLAIRPQDENNQDIQKFIKIYHSPEIREFIEKTYNGAVIPVW